jgi:serine/threonine-protein kinase RsbW
MRTTAGHVDDREGAPVRTTWRDKTTETTDSIELRVPADPAYLAVIRTAAAGLAARLDLTLDEIEDLRIAVDEACALLLDHQAHPGETVTATFTVGTDALAVHVTGPTRKLPTRDSFAWSVLEALVGEVETGTGDEGSWVRLTHPGGRRVP